MREQKDKVSIILPTRNRWKILKERALKSVLNQTHKNWELIIVHDGMSDEGIIVPDDRVQVHYTDKVYTYPKDDKKAEWLSGPCNALNYALSKVNSDSDYIARLDDDDQWHDDMLETMIKFIKSEDYDFVSACWDNGEYVMPPYTLHELKLNDVGFLGGVQTWLYRSKFKYFMYDGKSWKKEWNANNELDWFERFVKDGYKKIGFIGNSVCTILPRPGETEIGSKAYAKE